MMTLRTVCGRCVPAHVVVQLSSVWEP